MTSTTPVTAVGYAALWVRDVDRAAEFFARALGWTYDAATGGHRMLAQTTLPQSIVGLDQLPAGVWDGWPRRHTLFLSIGVPDVGRTVAAVRAAGGAADEPTDEHGGSANCADDQGLPFSVHSAPEPESPASQLAYVTLQVPSDDRARQFYGAVFGWQFRPGSHARGWQVDGAQPLTGIGGGFAEATAVPMYDVADITSTVDAIRAAGGAADEPVRRSFGLLSSCADDQGTAFHVGQLAS